MGPLKDRPGGNPSPWSQIFRFAMAGVVGFGVNAGIVEVLAHPLGPGWAQLVAFPLAASVTWWLNRRYTFGASQSLWHLEWMKYMTSNVLGWVANNGAYFLMILFNPFAYHHPALAVAVGSLAGMVFNFKFSRRFVFGQS
jgi:putative flippase GtrA